MSEARARLRSRVRRGSLRSRSSVNAAPAWPSRADELMALRARLASLPRRVEPNDPAVAAVLERVLENVQLEMPGTTPIDVDPVKLAPNVAGIVLGGESGERIVVGLKAPEVEPFLAGSSQRRTFVRALDDIDVVGRDDPLRV